MSLMISGCTKPDIGESSSISIYLNNSPAKYDKVSIEIKEIMVLFSNNKISGTWTSFTNFNNGEYNLTDLPDAKDTLLVTSKIMTGTISQILLIFGNNNSIVVDGIQYNLDVSPEYLSGIKIMITDTIKNGINNKINLNFDESKSIVQSFPGKFKLVPAIRSYKNANTGKIRGSVNPKKTRPYVYIQNGEETINSFADSAGNFNLIGIPKGIYTLYFLPDAPYEQISIDNVVVNPGETTDVGKTTIKKP